MKLLTILILAISLFSCSKPKELNYSTTYELYIYDSLGREFIFTKKVKYPITLNDSITLKKEAYFLFNKF